MRSLNTQTRETRTLRNAVHGDAGDDACQTAISPVAQESRWTCPAPARDGVHDIFSTVQGRVIGMMGGGAAEMAILGDSPSLFIESYVYCHRLDHLPHGREPPVLH